MLDDGQKKSPLPAIAITAALVGAVSGGLFWWKHKPAEQPQVAEAAAPQGEAPEPTSGAGPGPSVIAAPAQKPSAPPAPAETNLKSFTTHIRGALEGAIVEATDKKVGPPLTQVINRSLVWWLRVPQDLVKGDTLSVVYETRENMEPLVHAVRFSSAKLGKTFEAYRHKADGEKYAHFYGPDGVQLELQLVDGPLEEWEQITSLLRDGRKHQGVDFKCPSGTPVRATFDGVITRKTWSFGRNGNSLEIEESGGKGRHALYLHLSELPKAAQVGARVKKGDVIATSGNTGHSFAPHLHYQLVDGGGKLLDPFESHKTEKAAIATKDKPGLDVTVAKLNKLLDSDLAVTGQR
ncbi:MAG: peptidoglycan DD-metalloendopeptidase family protein [Myxococcaceae bacterium]|nr:peptidoglycan DD-metalloendopeptidase family protein [Myxococcaceae bacterium]